MEMDLAQLIYVVFGALLSLLFSYVPGAREWLAKQTPTGRRLVMLGFLLVGAGLLAGASCLNWWVVIECTGSGLKTLAEAFWFSLISNQATFLVTPELPSVKEIKENGKN